MIWPYSNSTKVTLTQLATTPRAQATYVQSLSPFASGRIKQRGVYFLLCLFSLFANEIYLEKRYCVLTIIERHKEPICNGVEVWWGLSILSKFRGLGTSHVFETIVLLSRKIILKTVHKNCNYACQTCGHSVT